MVSLKSSTILFICVENAGRSQMAEAFARKQGLEASSAGALLSSRVNPTVVEAMREKGINLSGSKPKMLMPEMIEQASLIIKMGCSLKEVCPRPLVVKMHKKLIDWHLDDPKGEPIEVVRRIRDKIEEKVATLSGEQTE